MKALFRPLMEKSVCIKAEHWSSGLHLQFLWLRTLKEREGIKSQISGQEGKGYHFYEAYWLPIQTDVMFLAIDKFIQHPLIMQVVIVCCVFPVALNFDQYSSTCASVKRRTRLMSPLQVSLAIDKL